MSLEIEVGNRHTLLVVDEVVLDVVGLESAEIREVRSAVVQVVMRQVIAHVPDDAPCNTMRNVTEPMNKYIGRAVFKRAAPVRARYRY